MIAPTLLRFGLFFLSQLHLTWGMVLAPRQLISCEAANVASSGDTCASFAAKWRLVEKLFVSLNPSINCSKLVAGQDYCVVGTFLSAPPASDSTLITSTRPPTATPSASGHPLKPGMNPDCRGFLLIHPGDSCPVFEAEYGISHDQFLAWNPTVNKDCTNIEAGYYYCISLRRHKSSINTSTKATLTKSITTPTPIQTGMATGCNKFYFVQPGDSCAAVAAEYNVPLATFYSWNPAVGSSCAALNVGYYINKMTATSSASNGIATPTPFQPGMVAYCKKFFIVRKGDTCESIATNQDTTLANIEKWNPGVGSSCTALWLNNYICVGV
ncbi:hypothetical protein GGI35DRAFT_493637 [Trichoderma velutinum]